MPRGRRVRRGRPAMRRGGRPAARRMRRGGRPTRPRRRMQTGGHTHTVNNPQSMFSPVQHVHGLTSTHMGGHTHDAPMPGASTVGPAKPVGSFTTPQTGRIINNPVNFGGNFPTLNESWTMEAGDHTHRQSITPRGRMRRGGRPVRRFQAGGGTGVYCPRGNYGYNEYGERVCK